MELMKLLHLYGAYFINYFQTSFSRKWQEDIFLFSSHIGDPRNAFIWYFPLLFAFNKREGKRLLFVATVSEWLNLVLKWCLRGERPYWWVNEANVNVTVKQFYLTCETGPGSPSGHVMVTCAVGVFVVLFLSNQQSAFKATTWLVYIAIVCLVSLSRIYIAAHFPHQIIFAFLIGNLIGVWVWKDATNPLAKFYFIFSASLIFFGLLSYELLSFFFDPGFSIPKAMKWCASRDFIKVDTTPFYSMVRDAGAVLGIGLAQLFPRNNHEGENGRFSVVSAVIQAMLSIVFAKGLDSLPLPVDKPYLFYLLGFLRNSFLVVTVIIFVPFIIDCCCVVVSRVVGVSKNVSNNHIKKIKK